MKRLQYLDQMKGIAIFLMVMGHVLLFTFGIQHEESKLADVFFINMPMFFYVSGFLLFKEINNSKDLLMRMQHKAARILPPWIIVTVVMTSIQKWNFFSTLCTFYWFFYVLFLLTLLTIVLEFAVFRRIRNSYLYCISLLIIPVVFAGIKFIGYIPYLPAPYLCQYSVPFLFGWACRKFSKLNSLVLNNPVLFVVSLFVFLFCWYKRDMMNNYILIVAALAGIIVLQSVLYHREVLGVGNPSIISKLGKSSLAIYTLNNFFLPDLRKLIDPSWVVGNGIVLEIVIVGLVTSAVIACCIVVETIFHNNIYLKKIL